METHKENRTKYECEQCPDCDTIFANLDDLENEVLEQNPSCVPFVDALRDLKEVYYISHAKELIQNHREIIKKNWKFMHETPLRI